MDITKISKVRAVAENYYATGDFYCSEAVVKSVLDGLEINYAPEIVAAASGFPVGIGGAECLCGAISGGIMAIGYVYGRTEAKSEKVNKAMTLSKELHKLFVQRNKCTCCRVLTKGMTKGSTEHMKQCVRFTGEVAEDTLRLIIENR
ncbi:MAG: C-GCAxxG-C-C family (seleno)protein [Bacteroidales bacterium]